MLEILRRVKMNSYFAAGAALVTGLLLLFWPNASLNVVCNVIGIGVLVISAIQLLAAFRGWGTVEAGYNLAIGILLLAVGIFFLTSPGVIGAIIPLIVGIYVVLHGFMELGRALMLFRERYANWWIALILSVVSIILGVFLVTNAIAAGQVLLQLVGALIVYDSVSNLWIISRVSKNLKQARKDLEDEINGNIID